jgi:hypothetical protein
MRLGVARQSWQNITAKSFIVTRYDRASQQDTKKIYYYYNVCLM